MSPTCRRLQRLVLSALGMFALVSCVDPFAFDNRPVTGGAAGAAGPSTTSASGTDSTRSQGAGGNTTISSGVTGTATAGNAGGRGGGSGEGGTGVDASAAGGSGGSTGAGGVTAGSGGTAMEAGAQGGAGGSGGSPGGASGSGASGSGASGGGAGGGGNGGGARSDAGSGKSDAGNSPDSGPLGARACPTDRFYPPIPDGGEATCPPHLADLTRLLPVTPAVDACTPLSHPGSDCPFYFFSWQNFLIATQPDAQGKPAFLSWGTIENVFGAGAGQPPPAIPYIGGGVTQAGGRQVLIDQRGHVIYYAIHMNQPFVDFVTSNGLQSAAAVRNADPLLSFPEGLVELKEAWMIVPDNAPPADYIVAKVRVPTLRSVKDVFNNNQIIEDPTVLRDVTVALLAIHVVYTLPGHPEFIWSTFQHVDSMAIGDVAATAEDNPDMTPANKVVSTAGYPLYKAGTASGAANAGVSSPVLDDSSQSFESQQTSIYRMFPASKSNTTDPDGDISSINENMTARFASANLGSSDRRGHYRLVGAIWQDRPDKTMTAPNRLLVNDETDPDIKINGADSTHSIVAGEDRLSSVAMESFTQGADSFPNCFSCHDTRATTARGVPSVRDQAAPIILQPKMINVSHVFNEVARLNP